MKKEEKVQLKKFYLMVGMIVVIIICIDQLCKCLIIHYEESTIIPNVLVLKADKIDTGTYEETSKAINIFTNLVILGIVFGIIKSNNQFITKKAKILLAFALAGGISNIIDRIFRGGIIEYINFANFPPVNIADICIAIGWIAFVAIFASFSAKELSNKKQAKEQETKKEEDSNKK